MINLIFNFCMFLFNIRNVYFSHNNLNLRNLRARKNENITDRSLPIWYIDYLIDRQFIYLKNCIYHWQTVNLSNKLSIRLKDSLCISKIDYLTIWQSSYPKYWLYNYLTDSLLIWKIDYLTIWQTVYVLKSWLSNWQTV